MNRRAALALWATPAVLAPIVSAEPASADTLYAHGGWAGLATDRSARRPGDLVTILVYESATASNSASSGSHKNSKLAATVSAGHFGKSAGLDLDGGSADTGTTGRSGQMVAQISATVDAVDAGGDLDVSGQQLIHINGERTLIKLKGRLRPADISAANTALSSRLADAAIDYDGSGFVSRSARPGPLARLFSWLGLM